MLYYIGLCLPKSQNVQRIILDRWLRKPLPILYILSLKVISRVVSLLSLLFSPDHFLRLTGVFPPGCALKISAKEKQGACSTTRATLQPTPRQSWTLPCLQDPCGVSQAGKLHSEVEAHWELSPASHRIILVPAAAFWLNYSFHSFVWVPFFSRVDQLLQLRFPFHIIAFTVRCMERDASNSQELTLDHVSLSFMSDLWEII